VLATEIVGTSITSPSWSQAATERVLQNNPHIKFGKSDQRGYTVLQVDASAVTVRLRVVDNARVQETAVSTAANFLVEAGRPGAQKI
jgi:alkaline phosphatase D